MAHHLTWTLSLRAAENFLRVSVAHGARRLTCGYGVAVKPIMENPGMEKGGSRLTDHTNGSVWGTGQKSTIKSEVGGKGGAQS